MNQRVMVVGLLVLLALGVSEMIADAQGPKGGPKKPAALAGGGFTYQGQLKNNGGLVTGSCNLQFGLWDDSAAGGQIGVTQTVTPSVTNGLFTVALNASNEITSGTAFDGNARWLAEAVRCPSGSGVYTALSPRQALVPTPYALFATAPWVTNGNTLYYNNGNVGIGTSSPNLGLDVEKTTGNTAAKFGAASPIYLVSDYPSIGFNLYYNGAWKFGKGSVNKYGGVIDASPDDGAMDFFATNSGSADAIATLTETMRILQSGTVGIGTSSPCSSTKLVVFAATSGFSCSSAAVRGDSSSTDGVEGFSSSGDGVRGGSATNGRGVYGSSDSGDAVYGQSTSGIAVDGFSGSSTGVVGRSFSGTHLFEGIDAQANNVRFAVERATGNVLADGSYSGPADFAEMMPITGVKNDYGVGDVLVIGPDGKLTRSGKPNATNLAGVYSAKPGFLGDTEIAAHGIEYYDAQPTHERLAVGLIGIMPVKVTDENGRIQPGDLLTVSSTPGHAMKAKSVMINGVEIYPTGTIVGKALESWEQGAGMIQVLVTLR